MPHQIFPLFFLLSVLALSCEGQSREEQANFTPENFAGKILAYEPPHRAEVSEKAYNKGTFFLEETRSATKNDPSNLNAGDYWNITMAFLQLQEPREHVRIAFQKAIAEDAATICAYISSLGHGRLDEVIPETFLPFYEENCLGKTTETEPLGLEAYLKEGELQPELVKLIYRIQLDDQRFRKLPGSTPMDKQALLDQKNQALIDSLFEVHQGYIGRHLVGEELEHVMWAVIQHSNPEMMERYLPVVHQAVQEEELPEVPLKMLIDRLYAEKYGYQIFGSQPGVPLAEEKIRVENKEKYGLE